MRKASFLLVFSVAMLLPAFGQAPAAARAIDNDFVQKQFGNQFTLLSGGGVAVGDLDGDGVEDIIIAARCKSPLLDEAEHNYTVMDPYNDFFGYGDPKLTTTFSAVDPSQRGLVVLIIYGAGKDGWRAETPKAKFVIVNLPYRAISIRKMKLRKKTVEAVYIEEASDTGDNSALFFDGKKFRYVPMGADMQ
jgi:hypothetical protein